MGKRISGDGAAFYGHELMAAAGVVAEGRTIPVELNAVTPGIRKGWKVSPILDFRKLAMQQIGGHGFF